MERYKTERSNGQTTVVRFCRCGRAAIIVSEDRAEHAQFENDWIRDHIGVGHELVDFDDWAEVILQPTVGAYC